MAMPRILRRWRLECNDGRPACAGGTRLATRCGLGWRAAYRDDRRRVTAQRCQVFMFSQRYEAAEERVKAGRRCLRRWGW